MVHTAGFNGKNYLNPSGDLMSDAMTVVERWSIVKTGSQAAAQDRVHLHRPQGLHQALYRDADVRLDAAAEADGVDLQQRQQPQQPGPSRPLNFTSAPEPSPNYTPPPAAAR